MEAKNFLGYLDYDTLIVIRDDLAPKGGIKNADSRQELYVMVADLVNEITTHCDICGKPGNIETIPEDGWQPYYSDENGIQNEDCICDECADFFDYDKDSHSHPIKPGMTIAKIKEIREQE